MTITPTEPFGPLYPALLGLAKHRSAARKGLHRLSPCDRQAYGDAVGDAIRKLQRSELQRELPTHNVSCASGSNHNTGAAIHKAMQVKQRAKLQAAVIAERRARSDNDWRCMYVDAMRSKKASK